MEDKAEWTNPRQPVELHHSVTLRIMQDADYAMLCGWWKAWGWEPVPQKLLPTALSIIAQVDGKDAAFGCLYVDSGRTGLGMIEWVVSAPGNSARTSCRAVQGILAFLLWRSGEDDLRCTFVMAACAQASLARFFEKCGFRDNGAVHYLSA